MWREEKILYQKAQDIFYILPCVHVEQPYSSERIVARLSCLYEITMYSRNFAEGSTSPPGGNQVDGLPPAHSLSLQLYFLNSDPAI